MSLVENVRVFYTNNSEISTMLIIKFTYHNDHTWVAHSGFLPKGEGQLCVQFETGTDHHTVMEFRAIQIGTGAKPIDTRTLDQTLKTNNYISITLTDQNKLATQIADGGP